MKVKSKKLKVKRGGQEDILLSAFAEKNKGKHGSDGDMFTALRREYAQEKREKKAARAKSIDEAAKEKSPAPKSRRALWICAASAAAAVLITLAATLPFIFRGKGPAGPIPPPPPQYAVVDGLTVVPVMEAQLYKELGPDIIIPRPKGYALDEIRLYLDTENIVKAYQYIYSNIAESATTTFIEVCCVINNDFTFSKEEVIDDYGANEFFPPFFLVRLFLDDDYNSLCRFLSTDKFIVSLRKHDRAILSSLIAELTA